MLRELVRNTRHFLRTEWKTLTVFALWMLTLMVIASAGIRYVVARKHEAITARPNQPMRQAEKSKCPMVVYRWIPDPKANVSRMLRSDISDDDDGLWDDFPDLKGMGVSPFTAEDKAMIRNERIEMRFTHSKCVECHKPHPKAE